MLTASQVLDATCDAVLDANQSYFEMSGGMNLQDSGVEAFVSSTIARRLYEQGCTKDGSAFATMENTYSQIFEWSNAKKMRGALPELLKGKGRVDVVLYNRQEGPIGIVEVKRHFGWSIMQRDVERMALILERCGRDRLGSLRWGCVAGFHTNWSSSRKDMKARRDDFKVRFSDQYPEMKIKTLFKQRPIEPKEDAEMNRITDFFAVSALFTAK